MKYFTRLILDSTKGLKNLGDMFLSTFKDIPLFKGIKNGLKGMIMAFQGKSFKEIEMQQLIDKIKKEEIARQQVRDEMESSN